MKIVIEDSPWPDGQELLIECRRPETSGLKAADEEIQKQNMAEYISFCRTVFEEEQKFLHKDGSDRSK